MTRSRFFGTVLSSVFGLGSGVAGQDPEPAPACRDKVLQGRVSTGRDYEATVSPEMIFRLEAETHPQNPAGWTIRITPPSMPDSDYSMVATPPYRFANPRYVDTSYGVTADGALALTPRRFAFVGSREDYQVATDALNILLWPSSHAPEQVEAARATLAGLRTYPGSFWIEDGGTLPPDSANPLGRIEWMSFRVDLCLPPIQGG